MKIHGHHEPQQVLVRAYVGLGLQFPSGFYTAAISIPAVEDASVAVEPDRLTEAMFAYVGDQGVERVAAQQWKEIGDGVELKPTGSLCAER